MLNDLVANPQNFETMKDRHSNSGVTWFNARMRIVDGIYDAGVLDRAQRLPKYYTEFANVCRGVLTAKPVKGGNHIAVMRPCGGLQIFDSGPDTIFCIPMSRPSGLSDAQFRSTPPNRVQSTVANLAVRIALMKGARGVLVRGDEAAVRPVAGGLVAYGLLSGTQALVDDGEPRWADPRHPLVAKMYVPHMHASGAWGRAETDQIVSAEMMTRPLHLGFIAPDPISDEHAAGRERIEVKENEQLGNDQVTGKSAKGFGALKPKADTKKYDRLPSVITDQNVEIYMNCATMKSVDTQRKQEFASEHGPRYNLYQDDMF